MLSINKILNQKRIARSEETKEGKESRRRSMWTAAHVSSGKQVRNSFIMHKGGVSLESKAMRHCISERLCTCKEAKR